MEDQIDMTLALLRCTEMILYPLSVYYTEHCITIVLLNHAILHETELMVI